MFFWCILQIEIESSTQEKMQEEGGGGDFTVYACAWVPVCVCMHTYTSRGMLIQFSDIDAN